MTDARTLAEFGDLVPRVTPAAHDTPLQHRAALVVDTAPGTAAALAGCASPVAVRQCALAKASAGVLRQSTGVPTAFGLAA